ncbi:MAG: 16S rRNA (guanine(527)-N(7))-methyltransferase RsmG [Caldilineales bacterium]|nr:16S rRNA (guanine(527)-N(7))-methyltransferase RsmG [Caldilineales bacterium]MDW8318303.1 16S rRNA (guanine(527)-N(7))-methyltransferase RsmG [Anaerolineae bacterium]
MNLHDAALQLGLALQPDQLAAFERYRLELIEWNRRFNLTSVDDPAAIETAHFLDSLSALLALPRIDGRPLEEWLKRPLAGVDVGAGAGFPGLPLKIAWPALRLTLVEATGKKCRFLQHAVDVLGLQDVTVVNARAEDFGQGSGRERFDLALARAVASLPTLLEYTLPLLRLGGWLVAQKGRYPGEEISAAQEALRTLGGSLHDVVAVTVPGLDAERHLVIVAKAAPTPAAYPRRAGIPKKHPLG